MLRYEMLIYAMLCLNFCFLFLILSQLKSQGHYVRPDMASHKFSRGMHVIIITVIITVFCVTN